MNDNSPIETPNDHALADSHALYMDMKQVIREMVAHGTSISDTARELRLPYATIWHFAHDLVKVSQNITGDKAFYEGRPRRIVVMEMHDKGISPRVIADTLNVEYHKVIHDIYYMRTKRAEAKRAEESIVERQPFSPKLNEGVDY